MTVVRLHSGQLWLHSVIPIDDALAEELAELGEAAHIVAPNRLHHTFLADAMRRYPNARVWAAPGLPEKRRDIAFDEILGDHPPADWANDLDQVHLRGNRWASEVVFLHRASRTLLLTDLLFNIRHAHGRFTRFVLRSMGAWGKLAQSKMWRITTRDRAAATSSVRRVLQWDFDRILLAHGDPVETDAKVALARQVSWLDPALESGTRGVRRPDGGRAAVADRRTEPREPSSR